jgi:hypothetical protein
MKTIVIILSLFLFINTLAFQKENVFIDKQKGYQIRLPKGVTIQANSSSWYIIASYGGKKILRGLFYDAKGYWQEHIPEFIRKVHRIDADGNEGSERSEDIDSCRIQKNRYGLTFEKYFLKEIDNNRNGTRTFIIGPYFGIDISKGSEKRVIIWEWYQGEKPKSRTDYDCQ